MREFQRVIGVEARAQMLAQAGALPDVVVACVGGGSNAIGLFHPFVADTEVKLLGFEAGGTGPGLGQNAASLAYGTPGVLQGCFSLLLQDEHGQIQETHSVSAGLDYPGVGPEHALLASIGRLDLCRGRGRRIARGARRMLPGRGHPAGHRNGARVRRCAQVRAATSRLPRS